MTTNNLENAIADDVLNEPYQWRVDIFANKGDTKALYSFYTDEVVFGAAYQQAVELRKRFASPRVDLSPVVVSPTMSSEEIRATKEKLRRTLVDTKNRPVAAIVGSEKFRDSKIRLIRQLLDDYHLIDICSIFKVTREDFIPDAILCKCDYVFVVCDSGYVGEATIQKIETALQENIPIFSTGLIDWTGITEDQYKRIKAQ